MRTRGGSRIPCAATARIATRYAGAAILSYEFAICAGRLEQQCTRSVHLFFQQKTQDNAIGQFH
jgi:hypothetical protein